MSSQLLAYLDPGTGSVILQALVGGVAGVVVIVKMGGRKFLSFLPIIGKNFRDTPIAHDTDEHDDTYEPGPPEDGEEIEPTDLASLLEDAADS